VIHVAHDGRVTVVTIDRPARRNAVDHATLVELRATIDRASSDGTRVLVLTGAGPAFSAGADLTGVETTGFADALRGVLTGLTEAPFATLAAVNGAALGAGCQLAIACDLRVAAPGAYFGVPANRLGLMVDAWTVRRLDQLVGGSVARAVLLAAEDVDADEAHRIGLANRLGAVEDALVWAGQIAGLAPLSLAGHKLSLERLHPPLPADDEVQAAFERVWRSADAQEGRQAFLEKRPPDFRGA
jgi:enoyl-CoA hydratase